MTNPTGNTTGTEAAVHDRTIRDMFAGIAGVYDRMNGLLSLGQDASWRRNLARAIDDDARDLFDACCGTGELILTAKAMGKGTWHVAGDFCVPMLRAGVSDHGFSERAQVLAADTQRLPLADSSFDAAMVGFGLRNLAELDRGLAELFRVLRPGGQLLVLEFFRARRSWVQAPISFYLSNVVPRMGKVFGGDQSAYTYLPQSMGRFVTVPEFVQALEKAGFSQNSAVLPQSFGVAHLVVARKP